MSNLYKSVRMQEVQHPYESKCRHVACLSCWTKVLAIAHECPQCQKPVQKRQLSTKYFA